MVAWELVVGFPLLSGWRILMCWPFPPLFSLNALQLPGPFSCGGYSSCRLLHILHLVIALSTGVGLGYRNLSGARPKAIGLVFG